MTQEKRCIAVHKGDLPGYHRHLSLVLPML
jgi:hypothetical protein